VEKAKHFREGILGWAGANLRDFPWRRTADPYVVLVTEKLLQRTSSSHVLRVWHGFFSKYPTALDLARAEEGELAELLRPLGLWRGRARELRLMASELVSKFGGEVPRGYEELVSLRGVGDYVAKATLLFAFGVPECLVDANTRKVAGRYLLGRGATDGRAVAEFLESATPRDPEGCKLFNWGLIDLSAMVCTRRPRCGSCPLRETCLYATSGGSNG
jgi:A/G-specific adenine glycosylase